METGTKVLIGIGVGIAVGAIIYVSVSGSTGKIVDEVLAKAPESSRKYNEPLLKKMSKGEISAFRDIVMKKENTWTKDEKDKFIALSKKYNLKVGG